MSKKFILVHPKIARRRKRKKTKRQAIAKFFALYGNAKIEECVSLLKLLKNCGNHYH